MFVRKMKTGGSQLMLALLIYMIPCSAVFWHVKKINGELMPMDPDVCARKNITFISKLLDSPKHNFSIGFVIRTRDTNRKYVAVDSDRVARVNETISKFTMTNFTFGIEEATRPVYVYVKSYYWQEFGGIDGALQLGRTTVARVFPMPEKVQDFKCIVMNYVSMRCTWDYGKQYGENMPEVTFKWSIPAFSASWTDCKDLSIGNAYCNWKNLQAGYFSNVNITIVITLKQKCGVSVSSEFQIDTGKIVKPNPISSISTKVVNSTCIQLLWHTADSESQYPKEHKINIFSKWGNVTDLSMKTTIHTEGLPHERTFCNLRPYTEYTFSVSIKPTGIYAGYYSDPRDSTSRTYSDVPSASPEVTKGGYSWNYRGCERNRHKRRVCVFWKSIKEDQKNGPMKGFQGLFTAIYTQDPAVEENWTEELIYGCSILRCNTSYYFTIKSRNINGTSEHGTTIKIPTFLAGIERPKFIVEAANNSEVYVSLNQQHTPDAEQFTVAWCRKRNGYCEPDHEVYWKHFASSEREVVLKTYGSPQDYLYGVSVLTEQGSSGVEWQDCVHLKDEEPKRAPQYVVVSAGSEDNTLVVTWDKLACKSDEPYIAMYSVQYHKLNDRKQEFQTVASSGRARIVLKDLEADQTYTVTVRGVTKDGKYGPDSQARTGTPENKSLKPAASIGISIAVLVCVIFAVIGFVFVLRRCKKKAKIAIKEAEIITTPDAPDQKVLYSFFESQNSKDSGYDMIQLADKCANVIKLSNPQFVLPYGYCYAATESGERTDTAALESELIHLKSELRNEPDYISPENARESEPVLVKP